MVNLIRIITIYQRKYDSMGKIYAASDTNNNISIVSLTTCWSSNNNLLCRLFLPEQNTSLIVK